MNDSKKRSGLAWRKWLAAKSVVLSSPVSTERSLYSFSVCGSRVPVVVVTSFYRVS